MKRPHCSSAACRLLRVMHILMMRTIHFEWFLICWQEVSGGPSVSLMQMMTMFYLQIPPERKDGRTLQKNLQVISSNCWKMFPRHQMIQLLVFLSVNIFQIISGLLCLEPSLVSVQSHQRPTLCSIKIWNKRSVPDDPGRERDRDCKISPQWRPCLFTLNKTTELS